VLGVFSKQFWVANKHKIGVFLLLCAICVPLAVSQDINTTTSTSSTTLFNDSIASVSVPVNTTVPFEPVFVVDESVFDGAGIHLDKEVYSVNDSVEITVLAEDLFFDLWVNGPDERFLALQNFSGSTTYIVSCGLAGDYVVEADLFSGSLSKIISRNYTVLGPLPATTTTTLPIHTPLIGSDGLFYSFVGSQVDVPLKVSGAGDLGVFSVNDSLANGVEFAGVYCSGEQEENYFYVVDFFSDNIVYAAIPLLFLPLGFLLLFRRKLLSEAFSSLRSSFESTDVRLKVLEYDSTFNGKRARKSSLQSLRHDDGFYFQKKGSRDFAGSLLEYEDMVSRGRRPIYELFKEFFVLAVLFSILTLVLMSLSANNGVSHGYDTIQQAGRTYYLVPSGEAVNESFRLVGYYYRNFSCPGECFARFKPSSEGSFLVEFLFNESGDYVDFEIAGGATESSTTTTSLSPELEEKFSGSKISLDKGEYFVGETVYVNVLSGGNVYDLWVGDPSGWVLALQNQSEDVSYAYFPDSSGNYSVKADFYYGRASKTIVASFEVVSLSKDSFPDEILSLVLDKTVYLSNETVSMTISSGAWSFDLWVKDPSGQMLALQNYSGDMSYWYLPGGAGKYSAEAIFYSGDLSKNISVAFEVIGVENASLTWYDSFGLVQGQIVFGLPVSWTQDYVVAGNGSEQCLPLPEDSFNVSVYSGGKLLSDSGCLNLGEGIFNVSVIFQTEPVTVLVENVSELDLASLIPADAVDIRVYENQSLKEEVGSLSELSSDLTLDLASQEVLVSHNSSLHYENITVPLDIPTEAVIQNVSEGVVTLVNDSAVLVDRLSNKSFILGPKIERQQHRALVGELVNWTLSAGNTTVEYSTPAPGKRETESVSGDKIVKFVTVESNASMHYYNVSVYSEVPEAKGRIRLYRLINGTRTDVTEDPVYNISLDDLNGNGLIDRLSWVVPQLSEDDYEIEIDLTILTVQSYPTIYGNWTVLFNTIGTANLTIRAFNGTTWSQSGDGVDLKFLEIRCGNTTLSYRWAFGDSVFVENYSCNETGVEVSSPQTTGKHNLEFTFGNVTKYAYNDVLSACGTLSTANKYYALDRNINATTTCLTIGANNITINCQGYRINYSQTGTGYGIDDSGGYDNITIANCTLVQGNASSLTSDGIRLGGALGCRINNNTISTLCSGVGWANYCPGITIGTTSKHNIISNNTIKTIGTYSYGIEFGTASTNNTISYNYFNISGNNSEAVATASINGPNYVYYNNINSSGDTSQGIFLYYSSNWTIYGNNITATGPSGYGVYLYAAAYTNNISNNSIRSTQSYAIAIVAETGNPLNNRIYNNLLNGSAKAVGGLTTWYNWVQYWNVSNQSGTRTYSNGNRIGGNYYTNSTGTGFSDACTDANKDGFCDSAYNVSTNAVCSSGSTCGNNTDYLALSDEYDSTAPVTSATAVKSDSTAYTFGTWTDSYVNITLSCSDAGVGCDKTVYCTDTANSCTPSTAINFFNISWPYRQNVSYSNTAGNLTNYQVEILANSSNVGANWNWSYNGSDVRITYYNSSTGAESEIPFCIEAWNSTTTNATIWVNVSFLENNTSTTIYMYYGNFSLTSKSNGNKTFNFFDHFDGASINTNIWQGTTGGGTVANSILSYGSGTNSYIIIGKTSFGVNYTVESRSKFHNGSSGFWDLLGFADGSTWVPNALTAFYTASGTSTIINHNPSDTNPTSNYAILSYQRQTLSRNGTASTRFFQNGVECLNSPVSGTVPTGSLYPAIGNRYGNVPGNMDYYYVDWIAVRKYVSAEPTQSTGSQEVRMKVSVSTPGTSYIRYRSNDTAGNLETTNNQTIMILGQPPNISLMTPVNLSGDNEGNVDFWFNASDDIGLSNCSLFLNGTYYSVNTSMLNNTPTSFSVSGLGAGSYNWSINCSDIEGTNLSSGVRFFDVVITTGYNGNTTNLSAVTNISSVGNFTLEALGAGVIWYNATVNLSGGLNITSLVNISSNYIFVNSSAEPRLNRSAKLIFSNLPYAFTPVILRDGVVCSSGCIYESYSNGNLTFNVTGFTNYTSAANTNLTIWDDTDALAGSQSKYQYGNVTFYANYTNKTSGASVNGSGVYCNITFNVSGTWTGWNTMTFDPSTLLYKYNQSFTTNGTFNYNITCNGSARSYEVLNGTDTVLITNLGPTLNFTSPTLSNGSNTTNNSAQANISIIEPNLDTFKFNWNTANYSVYDKDLVLAYNFNNNSAIGENYTRAVDISSYGNNGTLNGSTIWTTSGRFGGAAQFDGSGDNISLGNINVIGSGGLSVCAWVYLNSTGTTNDVDDGGIFCQDSTNAIILWYNVNAGGTGDRTYSFSVGTTATANRVNGGTDIAVAGTWQHVCGVMNGSDRILYLNGIQNAMVSTGATTVPSSTAAATIGGWAGSTNFDFNGSIDEVRIYNHTLNASEIFVQYQSEFAKYNSTEYRFYVNVTNLTVGTYSYSGWANDTFGNINSTDGGLLRYLNYTSPCGTLGTANGLQGLHD
jgi:hypothetical protein